ncbi:MAG: amino acid--tRNA ligase-related protein [Planctomycetaceae bacterium]
MCPLTNKASGRASPRAILAFVHGLEVAKLTHKIERPAIAGRSVPHATGLAAEDSMAKMDHDFVRALKVRMLAAGRMGIGIDRLVMLLTDTQTIRDVIFFPLLKPEVF